MRVMSGRANPGHDDAMLLIPTHPMRSFTCPARPGCRGRPRRRCRHRYRPHTDRGTGHLAAAGRRRPSCSLVHRAPARSIVGVALAATQSRYRTNLGTAAHLVALRSPRGDRETTGHRYAVLRLVDASGDRRSRSLRCVARRARQDRDEGGYALSHCLTSALCAGNKSLTATPKHSPT